MHVMPMMKSPTPRMHDVAAAIAEARKTTGQSPTYRELAGALQLSLGRVVDLCRAARERGLIDFTEGERRSFRVLNPRRIARHTRGQGRP